MLRRLPPEPERHPVGSVIVVRAVPVPIAVTVALVSVRTGGGPAGTRVIIMIGIMRIFDGIVQVVMIGV
jgi:hypothetical protein